MKTEARERILLVDSQASGEHAVDGLLSGLGHEIETVGEGFQALRIALKSPHLIIISGSPRDMGAVDLCGRLKENPATAHIPILGVCFAVDDRPADGRVDAFLDPPIDSSTFVSMVKLLLRFSSAERASQASHHQWRTTFEAIDRGILLLGLDGRIIRANQAFSKLMKLSLSDSVGQQFHECLEIKPEFDESPYLQMIASNTRSSVEISRGDRWLEVSVEPVQGEDGAMIGALGIVSDISDARKLDEYDRERIQEQLEASTRRHEFLATLAHELRNPLAPILNSLEVIRLSGPMQPIVKHALEIAGRQVRHMARLLEDLLDVSRCTRGKMQIHHQPVQLGQVIQYAVETATPRVLDKGQTLEVMMPPGVIIVEGDALRLEQVIGNLLNNAVKYTDRGGKIELALASDSGTAVIRIKDNGIGLSSDMLTKIFEPFSQAILLDDHTQDGLGIGLTLVKSIVELHGGTVLATSLGHGQGSEFIITLPIKSSLADEGAPVIDQKMNGKRSVLVVDDHPDTAASLAQILECWGHRVEVAYDGFQAIDLMDLSSPFDLILLDIGLPGMDGYQIAKKLRSLEGNQRGHIVALTGYGESQDFLRSNEAGIDHHLIKPVNPSALQAILTGVPTRPTRPAISPRRDGHTNRSPARGNSFQHGA